MKQSLFKRIALCALFSLIGLAMNAQTETTVNGIKYTLNNGVATVASNQQQGLTGAIVIPEKVTYNGTDYAVTSFADNAFVGCSAITSISFPSSVTSLGAWCFDYCSALTSITIPSSVISLYGSCFGGCTSLTSINVDGANAKYCSDNGTLFNKDKTVMLKLPEKFSGTYTIPSSVTSLGQDCFEGCSALTSVTIPSSVTDLRDNCFKGCTGLTSITIPSLVTSLEQNCFEGCTGLTSVTIPSSVTSLGNDCFLYCTGLTSITIPSSVTDLGIGCFANCTSLSSITIPSSVTSIEGEGDCFFNCQSLMSINVDGANAKYCSDNGILFNKDKTAMIKLPEKFSGAYTIPSSFTSLGQDCFEGCAGLTSIAIPSSVTNIDEGCFYGCTRLTSITIPSSVTSLGEGCFWGCASLTSIIIPSSVTSLERDCFKDCTRLTSITIPSSVTSIGYGCFCGCTGLTSVTCLATTPPNIKSDKFGGYGGYFASKATLYVPKGTSAAYKAAGWSLFGKILEVDENGTPLKSCATPVISYKEGHLTFTSETENAKCHYMITDADVNSSYAETAGDEVLAAAYHISAYATADDYNQSETATATLYWIENASTDGIEKPVTRGVFATVDGSTITLSGLTSGESVSFYTAAGVLLGTAKASGTEVSYNTNLTHQIVIVKIGKSSIKVSL